LHQSGVGIRFKFAICADEHGIGLGGYGWPILRQAERASEESKQYPCHKSFHDFSLEQDQ